MFSSTSYQEFWERYIGLNGLPLLRAVQNFFPDRPPWEHHLFIAFTRGIQATELKAHEVTLKELAKELVTSGRIPEADPVSERMWDGLTQNVMKTATEHTTLSSAGMPSYSPSDEGPLEREKKIWEKLIPPTPNLAKKFSQSSPDVQFTLPLTLNQFLCLEVLVRRTTNSREEGWPPSVDSIHHKFKKMTKEIEKEKKRFMGILASIIGCPSPGLSPIDILLERIRTGQDLNKRQLALLGTEKQRTFPEKLVERFRKSRRQTLPTPPKKRGRR